MATQFSDLPAVHLELQPQMDVIVFTVLGLDETSQTMTRLYSSHPQVFEVGKSKRTDRDVAPEWVRACLGRHEPHLAGTPAEVAAIFSDSKLIASLGCGACINAPVIDGGMTLALLNILGPEGRYGRWEVRAAARLASRSVLAVKQATEVRR